jgi:hypothetical protein
LFLLTSTIRIMTLSTPATVALATMVLVGAGCATGGSTTASEPPAERVYRTGSNIPVRDHTSQTADDKAKQSGSTPSNAPRPVVTP